MNMDVSDPLNDGEQKQLREFLSSSQTVMSFAEAEGYITALGAAPNLVMPSVWIRDVLGDVFLDSIEDVPAAYRGLTRLYNQNLEALHRGEFRPLSDLDDEQELASWCAGYTRAARADQVWCQDEYAFARLFSLAVLGNVSDLVGQEDAEGVVITNDAKQRRAYREDLPRTVCDLHEYWTTRRQAQMTMGKPGPVVSTRIGRNEPCPCGSGKKFKRCCALTG